MADQDKIGRRGVKAVIDHYDDFMETIGHTGEKNGDLCLYPDRLSREANSGKSGPDSMPAGEETAGIPVYV